MVLNLYSSESFWVVARRWGRSRQPMVCWRSSASDLIIGFKLRCEEQIPECHIERKRSMCNLGQSGREGALVREDWRAKEETEKALQPKPDSPKFPFKAKDESCKELLLLLHLPVTDLPWDNQHGWFSGLELLSFIILLHSFFKSQPIVPSCR